MLYSTTSPACRRWTSCWQAKLRSSGRDGSSCNQQRTSVRVSNCFRTRLVPIDCSLESEGEGLHADITFQAKGGTVKAHRSVLATASSVFREMFQHEMKALQLPSSVSLPDMAIESLRLFLILLYITNEKTRAMPEFNAAVDKHFTALFDAIHKFQVEGRLNAILRAGLLRHLTPANCWDFYHKCKGSTLLSGHAFSEACLSYVMKNIEKVMKSATTVLEMQRNPKVVQRCIIEAMSKGLCCKSCRQETTPKRKKPNAQTHGHTI